MATVAHAVGLTCSGLASGLALAYPVVTNRIFLSKAEHLTGGTDAHRLSIWKLGYDRGLATIPSLAAIGAVALSSSTYWSDSAPGQESIYRYVASALHVSIVPFTFLFMLATVKRLEHLEATKGDGAKPGEVDQLLAKWSSLHLVRAVLTVSAFGIAVSEAVGLLK